MDDNQDAADSLAEVLLAQGRHARAAYGGREAIRLATEKSFDVALVDIGMPTVDGLEVARQISHSPAGKHTLLVAVTGWSASADRERSKEAGFAYHLTKPVDYDTLGALLSTAARRKRSQRPPPQPSDVQFVPQRGPRGREQTKDAFSRTISATGRRGPGRGGRGRGLRAGSGGRSRG